MAIIRPPLARTRAFLLDPCYLREKLNEKIQLQELYSMTKVQDLDKGDATEKCTQIKMSASFSQLSFIFCDRIKTKSVYSSASK